MAIQGFLNFETGDLSECAAVAGSFAASTATPHSGAYCGRSNPSGSGTGFIILGTYVATTCQVTQLTISAGSTFYVRFRLRVDALPSATEQVFATLNGGTPLYTVTLDATGVLQLRFNGATVLATSGGVSLGTWHLVELSLKTSGSVASLPWSISVDGSAMSGSTVQNSGAIDEVTFGKNVNFSGSGYDVSFDDIAWSTSSAPASQGVGSVLVPSGPGSNADWTGSYADLAEIPSDGAASVISTTHYGDVSDFTLTSTSVAGITPGSTINAIKLVIYAESDVTNTVYFNLLIGGTTYGFNLPTLPIGSFPPFGVMSTTNPATGLPWTTGDLDALQVRIDAADIDDTKVSTVYLLIDYTPAPVLTPPVPRAHAVRSGPARRLPTPAILRRSNDPPRIRQDPLSRTAITVVPIPEHYYLNRD